MRCIIASSLVLSTAYLCVLGNILPKPILNDTTLPYPIYTPDNLPPGGITFQNCTNPYERYDCGGACQTECQTLGEACDIVNIRCNDLCYCIPGYARNNEGTCIPQKYCPPKKICSWIYNIRG